MKDQWKHGGNVYETRRKLGVSNEKIVDFSANINPVGWPKGLKKALIEGLDDLIHYPDPDYPELKEAISKYTQTDSKWIQLGNGAIELLYMLVEYMCPQKATVIAPGFIEYERSLMRYGAEIEWMDLVEGEAFQLNFERFKKSVQSDTDLVILCSPNNPTGHLIQKEELVNMVMHCKKMNCPMIVDESFIDFVGNEASITDLIEAHSKLYILRSMTKFFAIPGLRLGYLLTSDQALHSWCEEYRTPWMINHLANVAGITVLQDAEFVKKSLDVVPHLRVQLCEALRAFKKLNVYESQANYVFFKSEYEGLDLKTLLFKYGIMIRSCSNYRGLNHSYYRIAVKTEEENRRLINVLREIIPE